MSFDFKNPTSQVLASGPISVSPESNVGTNFSAFQVGGFTEVFNISDLGFSIPSGETGTILYSGNTIPIDFSYNSPLGAPNVINLYSDGISSGRRRLGMLAYVYETDTVYQFTIHNYENLFNSAQTANSLVNIGTGFQCIDDTQAGANFISAWTGNTVEGISGATRASSNWIKYNPEIYLTGGTYTSGNTTLTLYDNTGGTITVSGFTAQNSGTSGTSGDSGTSGTSGGDGTSGTSGGSGTSGTSGSSGISAVPITLVDITPNPDGIISDFTLNTDVGSAHLFFINGQLKKNGVDYVINSGTSLNILTYPPFSEDYLTLYTNVSISGGTSGSGASGTSGTSGGSGTSGTGFSTISNPTSGRVIIANGTINSAEASSGITITNGQIIVSGSNNNVLDVFHVGAGNTSSLISRFKGGSPFPQLFINQTGNAISSYHLDVNGSVNSGDEGYSVNNNKILLKFENNSAILCSTSNIIFSGSNNIYMPTIGNVGIGFSSTPSSKLQVYGTSSSLLSVSGSNGNLIEVVNQISGNLLEVGTLDSKPIVAINTDGNLYFNVGNAKTVSAGGGNPTDLYQITPTSGNSVFFDYFVYNTSSPTTNYRVGNVSAYWNSTTIGFKDNIYFSSGSTADLTLSVYFASNLITLGGFSTSSTWSLKATARVL